MRMHTIPIADKGQTKLIAHRGVSGLECENTAAAFVAAGNRSYFGIETDIWRTADGQFLCNHDGRTGRICATDCGIEQTPLAALRALVLNDLDGTPRADLRLTTPQEYCAICRKYGKRCVPELKSDFTADEIRQILDIFADCLDDTCFIAFNRANLDLVKQLRPAQDCQFLTAKWSDALPAQLAACGMGLDIYYRELTADRIRACHAHGVRVNCWTVDDPADAQQLIAWGIDEITSNILE